MFFSLVAVSLISVVLYFFLQQGSFPVEKISGKKVLITGASQGIGKSLVEEYAKRGASHIVIASRNKQKLDAVRDHTLALYPKAKITVVPSDISSRKAAEALISSTVDILGGLDILVLNHITSSRFGTWLVDAANSKEGHTFLEEIFSVNTLSYIWLTTFAMESLSKSGGSIGVVSSLAGIAPSPKVAAYSASKHALHGFFDSLRVELQYLKMSNVSITLCAIGATDTEGASVVKDKLSDVVKWDPPNLAAESIARGIAMRKRAIYHPFHLVYPSYLLHTFLPDLFDYILLTTLR